MSSNEGALPKEVEQLLFCDIFRRKKTKQFFDWKGRFHFNGIQRDTEELQTCSISHLTGGWWESEKQKWVGAVIRGICQEEMVPQMNNGRSWLCLTESNNEPDKLGWICMGYSCTQKSGTGQSNILNPTWLTKRFHRDMTKWDLECVDKVCFENPSTLTC